MKKSLKRILSMFFIVVMSLSFGGCGSKATTVEITIDNWQDYFELEERFVTIRNDFDEIVYIYKDYFIVLKDNYELVGDDTSIAVEFNYVDEWRFVETDKEGETLTIGELVPDEENNEKNGCTTTITTSETQLINALEVKDEMQTIPTNFEIVRFKGSMTVREK